MPRKQNALVSGAFHLERSLTELLEQNPEVLQPNDAKRLRTAINGITDILPAVKELARTRQAQLNSEEMRESQ
jgi:hypothetical protein